MEHADLIRSLPLTTVVDIGANVGQFSLMVVGVIPGVHVYAFEPLSVSSNVFEKLFIGNGNVVLHKFAVGKSAERIPIRISRRPDSSSLLRATSLQTEVFPGTETADSEIVQVLPIDRVLTSEQLKPPALVKLDVQGYELKALEGCASLLPLFSYVYLEISFGEFYEGQATASELFDYLRQRGFDFKGVYNTVYDRNGLAAQCDCFFARPLQAPSDARRTEE